MLLHVAFIAVCIATLFPMVWMLRTAFAPFSGRVPRHAVALARQCDTGQLRRRVPASSGRYVVRELGGGRRCDHARQARRRATGGLRLRCPVVSRTRCGAVALVIERVAVPSSSPCCRPTWRSPASGLYDTLTGVIVPTIGHCGFVVFFLRQAFKALPRELFEAARIDGAGPWRQMLTIALPNIWGAVAAMAVLSFLGAWNLYCLAASHPGCTGAQDPVDRP